MNIQEFNTKKKISDDKQYYFVNEEDTMFVQTITNRHPYKLPNFLKDYSDIVMFKVSPKGKTIVFGSIEITE